MIIEYSAGAAQRELRPPNQINLLIKGENLLRTTYVSASVLGIAIWVKRGFVTIAIDNISIISTI